MKPLAEINCHNCFVGEAVVPASGDEDDPSPAPHQVDSAACDTGEVMMFIKLCCLHALSSECHVVLHKGQHHRA